MKFTVSRDELADKLQTVLSVVSTRTTLPILGNILIKGDGEQLQIAATDLDLSVTCTLAAKVSKGGVTTVPGRTFSDMVRELPEEDVVVNVSLSSMVTNRTGAGRGTWRISAKSLK